MSLKEEFFQAKVQQLADWVERRRKIFPKEDDGDATREIVYHRFVDKNRRDLYFAAVLGELRDRQLRSRAKGGRHEPEVIPMGTRLLGPEAKRRLYEALREIKKEANRDKPKNGQPNLFER